MERPPSEKAAPGGYRGAAFETVRLGGANADNIKQLPARHQATFTARPTLGSQGIDKNLAHQARKLAVATRRLNSFTDRLALIADWREELSARIERATVRFEGDGIAADEVNAIAAEVAAFGAACDEVAASIRARPPACRQAA